MRLRKYRLQIVLVLLIALFVITLPRERNSFKGSFIPDGAEVERISLAYSKEGSLAIKKCGALWLGEFESVGSGYSDSEAGKKIFFPCDTALVEKLIDNARKVVKVSEISDSLLSQRTEEDFSLSQQDSFFLEFAIKNAKNEAKVSKFRFGRIDHFGDLSFCRDGDSKVYSASGSEIFNYLKPEPSFWASPELFPAAVLGDENDFDFANASVSESVLHLRHGGVLPIPYDKIGEFDWTNPAATFSLFSGSGDIYKIELVEDNGARGYGGGFEDGGTATIIPDAAAYSGDYLCRFIAFPAAVRPEEERAAIKEFNYVMKVSSWTFRRLLDGN